MSEMTPEEIEKERRVIDVTVLEYEDGGYGIYEKGGLDAMIKRIMEAREAIPEQYRAEALFALSGVNGYDGEVEGRVRVFYSRPETDKEVAARVARYELARDIVRVKAVREAIAEGVKIGGKKYKLVPE